MISLSIVVPYFEKLAELRAVLPYNARYLGRPDVELVLVLDEPSQEAEVLALLDQLPLVKARVIVNDRPHAWRSPCVAINVGLRAATGRYVLVLSPETVFAVDVPSRILEVLSQRPTDVVLGRIAWATFEEANAHHPAVVFDAAMPVRGGLGFAADYYGSIAASRDLFHAVRGFDESLSGWGGDDDNVRARLSMAGAMLMLDSGLKLVHLSDGAPNRDRAPGVKSPERTRAIVHPPAAQANPEDWGVEFGRVARDWSEPSPAPDANAHIRPERFTTGSTGRRGAEPPNVVAVFSYRYDAHLVEDLIANVSPIVDAWVAYDDRDSQALFSNEVPRRRALLRKAFDLGARWVLAMDPDERVEHGLAARIDEMTRQADRACWSFNLREMYAPDQYRTDGVWGTKAQARLFPLRGDLILNPNALHAPWCSFPARDSGLNLYHLKMIDPERRRARSALYSALDPNRQFQPIGYDYLADEVGATFETIPAGREYSPAHHDDGALWMPPVDQG